MIKKLKKNFFAFLFLFCAIILSSIGVVNVTASNINYLKVDFENMPTTAYLGETVYMGDINVCYPDKVKNTSVMLISPQGNTVEISQKRFVAQEQGEYKIFAKTTGFDGEVFTNVYSITVEKAAFPVLTKTPVLPTAFVCGVDYYNASLFAEFVDYNTKAPETVDYEMYYMNEAGDKSIIDNSLRFDGNMDGEVVELIYQAKSSITNEENSVVYKVPVVKIYDDTDGTKKYNFEKLFLTNKTTKTETLKNGVAFYGEQDFSGEFINSIYSNIDISFSAIDGLNNFDYVTYTFSDIKDNFNVLTLDVRKMAKNTVELTLNGKNKAVVTGSYENETENFTVSFRNDDLSFKDLYNETVLKPTTTFYGTQFEGFTDNKVKVSFAVHGVRGRSGVLIKSINKQAFQNNRVTDRISPYAETVTDIDIDMVLGERLEIPSVVCYDVLDPLITNCVVSCFSPLNNEVGKDVNGVEISKLSADKSYYIDVTVQGLYTLSYECSDVSGNTFTIYQSIYVTEKISPTLELTSQLKSGVKLGGTITIPNCTYKDNYTKNEDLVLVVTLSGPGLGVKRIEAGQEYKFDKVGVYYLRYTVYDENYNVAFAEIKLVCQ